MTSEQGVSVVGNHRVARRVDEGLGLRDRLKAAGDPFGSQVVFDLIASLRASNALNSVLHRDLQAALSAATTDQRGGEGSHE